MHQLVAVVDVVEADDVADDADTALHTALARLSEVQEQST
ncbi:hypothetical protein IWX65_001027 [Arthrobacter sp. CAN_A214]